MQKNIPIGEKFNRLVILSEGTPKTEKNGYKRTTVICQCDCGNTKEILLKQVKSGRTSSCGCLHREIVSNVGKNNIGRTFDSTMKIQNGTRYGRLVVINETERKRAKSGLPQRMFDCICDCGTIKSYRLVWLRNGKTTSCGCYRKEKAFLACSTHNESRAEKLTPEYKAWGAMKTRCYNKNVKGYKNYGGRGITVCDEWVDSYETFLADMGRKPSPEHSLERIDNNKGYSKENCKWATQTEQANNQRSNIKITINGETFTLQTWANKVNIRRGTIKSRINRGWTPEKAVLTPVIKQSI